MLISGDIRMILINITRVWGLAGCRMQDHNPT